MSKFQMTCSCKDTMVMDAENREGAIEQFKNIMNESAIAAHMAEKHPGAPVMSVADCHAQIEKDVTEVANN